MGLYGLKKELPSVWEDLGMRSASAYGKTRSVKSCVGKNSVDLEHNIRLNLVLD